MSCGSGGESGRAAHFGIANMAPVDACARPVWVQCEYLVAEKMEHRQHSRMLMG
jgi:hypothetical protein